MDQYSFDSETRVLFQAIKKYRRLSARYIHGKPSPEDALRRLEDAYQELVEALSTPKVVERIDALLASGRGVIDGTAAQSPIQVSDEDFLVEADMAVMFGLKPKSVVHAVQPGMPADTTDSTLLTAEDLIGRIESFHDSLIEKTENARNIEKRIEKKKRKRNIGQAVTSILFGSGCAVLNTYIIPGIPFMTTSYAVSLAAFHNAARDLVGERPKD